ncbi:cupredoxin domain-containing protein [Arthrobacter sp. TB 26]|uniref:cupredoxin domain-containing protein n=1 Tax=Arthrobacter sp. TB 26 TaxID=494420 RepID=UPI00040FB104|nr:cupredoxin domain-containing protein [Arthrobacter sp. TB 26]
MNTVNTAKVPARWLAPVLAGLLVPVLAGLGGCAAGGGSPAPASTPGQVSPGSTVGAMAITIKDFGFGAPVTVSPGATVTVTNLDSAAHTVTADDGSAFNVDVKGSGGTGTFTAPMQPGTYTYHCIYHPQMHGTLTVK